MRMHVQDSVASLDARREGARVDLELWARRLHLHHVAGPLLLSVAYYSGAQIGFALQAPERSAVGPVAAEFDSPRRADRFPSRVHGRTTWRPHFRHRCSSPFGRMLPR